MYIFIGTLWLMDGEWTVGGEGKGKRYSYSGYRSDVMWPRVMMVKGRWMVVMDLEMFGKFSEMMTTALFY